MSQAWFKASAEFIMGLDDQDGTFFQDDQGREKCIEQHNGIRGDTEDDTFVDGVVGKIYVIEEAIMLPTMSSNIPQAGSAAISEFFAEFDALKKEVLLIKRRKDDEFDELRKRFSKLETSETFVKFIKLLTNDLCTDEVFLIWKTFGRITRDLGPFGEETDKTTNLHQHLSGISTQKLETASQITRDAVTTHLMTTSQDSKTSSEIMTQPII
nr:hypothetical protein [Tanacetum cinerariifolium]